MTDMELLTEKVDAITAFMMANTQQERGMAELRLRNLQANTFRKEENAEQILRRILLEIGAPDHLIGYQYIIDAVLMVVENPNMINRITDGFYLKIGQKNGVTISKVERGIRYVAENVFINCPEQVLYRYFGNTVSPDRGKPTNGEFIARMANVVREQLKRK